MVASMAHATRFARLRAQTRDALLDAAIELFQNKGIRPTTIEVICERADVSQRTFFNHFETRDHLYTAVGQRRLAWVISYLDALAGDPRPFQPGLQSSSPWSQPTSRSIPPTANLSESCSTCVSTVPQR
jgi:AcrR family transcriptional regulator